jgi:hypothetical protein
LFWKGLTRIEKEEKRVLGTSLHSHHRFCIFLCRMPSKSAWNIVIFEPFLYGKHMRTALTILK